MWGRDTWPYVLAFYRPKNLLNRVMEGKTMLVLSSMPKLTIWYKNFEIAYILRQLINGKATNV